MASDIVERLRSVTEEDAYALPWTFGQICREAADELESARERADNLHADLEKVRDVISGAIGELKIMVSEEDKREGERRHFYQVVDAARDTLEIYFRRYALATEGKEGDK